MATKTLLIIAYSILGIVNIYCFLFQRTTRKIRRYAVGTTNIKLQNEFLPDWYFWFYFASMLRFIPIIWLAFLDWKIAVITFIIVGIMKLILPVNDYAHIQKIKKHFEKKIATMKATDKDFQLLEIVLEAEKKTV